MKGVYPGLNGVFGIALSRESLRKGEQHDKTPGLGALFDAKGETCRSCSGPDGALWVAR